MSKPIFAPSRAISLHGLAFGGVDSEAVAVDPANPLPVAATTAAATSVAVTGSAAAAGYSPVFTPQLGREIVLTLSGVWSGTVSLLRSVDGGLTKLPATIGGSALQWTGNVNEIVWVETEAATTLYLQLAPVSGTITYRVAQ